MRLEPFEERVFATCTHPKVRMHYPIIFCGVERMYDSGCGKVGKHFESEAASGASHGEASGGVNLKNSKILWVERVAQGRKPR